MSLLDDFERDMQDTFFNPEEFAYEILWNGFPILAVPEEKENVFNPEPGVYESTDIYHIMQSELNKYELEKPEPETQVVIDSNSRLIKSVYEKFGCLKVEFYRNRY